MQLSAWLTLITVIAPCPLWAQWYRVHEYGQEHRLKNLVVLGIGQDSTGYMWLATENGVYRFNGRLFEEMKTADGSGTGRVRGFGVLGNQVWYYNRNSAGRWVDGRPEVIDIGTALMSGSIQGVASDGQRVYLAAQNGLLICGLGAAPQCRMMPLARSPEAIAGASNGGVWLTGGNQIYRVSAEGELRPYSVADGLPASRWWRFATGQDGLLWVRSRSLVASWSPRTDRFEVARLPRGIDLDQGAIIVDRDGAAWVSGPYGLLKQEGDSWRHFGPEHGLPSISLAALAEDAEGGLWMGSDGAGMFRWAGFREWSNWTYKHGLEEEGPRFLDRGLDGTLWLGGDNGIYRLAAKRDKWEPAIPEARGKRITAVKAIGSDLWFGVAGGTLCKATGGHITACYGKPDGLTVDEVRHLGAHQNRLFVASLGDLHEGRLDVAQPRFRSAFAGENRNFYSVSSSNGFFLVAGRKLSILQEGRWEHLGAELGLKAEMLRTAAVVGNDLWVSYRDPLGLTQVSDWRGSRKVRHFTTAMGLLSDRISFLQPGAKGQLWVGSDAGVQRWDGKGWTTYTMEDGLVWQNTHSRASVGLPDGQIWIGTSRGVSHYRPAAPPPKKSLAITTEWVRFGGKPADLSRPLRFPHVAAGDAGIEAAFAVLLFSGRSRLEYQFRLDGIEHTWATAPLPEVRYPSLPAGTYDLRFRVRRQGEPWVELESPVTFETLPAWWNTTWFRGICLILVCGGVWMLYRWRLFALRAREAALKSLVESRTRELAEARDQALAGSTAKARFLATMSHEIRTPMNGVLGMTRLLLDTPLNGDQREYAMNIEDAAGGLLNVINDVLDYSKIEAGKLTLENVVFDLAGAVHSSMRLIQASCDQKGLSLACFIAPDFPRSVTGDPTRLRQILLNYLSNAVKFTAYGGVTVRVYSQREDGGHMVRFEVEDTGTGIPDGARDNLFQSFTQADSSTTRKFGGTGLGLAICRQLAELMGGQTGFETEFGKGSTFWFTARLPSASPVAASDWVVAVSGLNERQRSAVDTILQAWGIVPAEFDPALSEPQIVISSTPYSALPAEAGRVEWIDLANPPRTSEMTARLFALLGRPSRIGCALGRVLVVEDNALNQKLALRMLEKAGALVKVASDGEQALAMLAAAEFDLILMDCQMPVLDGYETTRRIRMSENDAGRLPIIAMTANATEPDRQLCFDVGMDDYIAKPVDFDVLRIVLNRWSANLRHGKP